jgi:hypothetical protein
VTAQTLQHLRDFVLRKAGQPNRIRQPATKQVFECLREPTVGGHRSVAAGAGEV